MTDEGSALWSFELWSWQRLLLAWVVGAVAILAVVAGVRVYGMHVLAESHRLSVETATAHGVASAGTASETFMQLTRGEAARIDRPTRWLRLVGYAGTAIVSVTLLGLLLLTGVWLRAR